MVPSSNGFSVPSGSKTPASTRFQDLNAAVPIGDRWWRLPAVKLEFSIERPRPRRVALALATRSRSNSQARATTRSRTLGSHGDARNYVINILDTGTRTTASTKRRSTAGTSSPQAS